jgi:hypothetical protein
VRGISLEDFEAVVIAVVATTSTSGDMRFDVRAATEIVAAVQQSMQGLGQQDAIVAGVTRLLEEVAARQPLSEANDAVAVVAATLLAEKNGFTFGPLATDDESFQRHFASASGSDPVDHAGLTAWVAARMAAENEDAFSEPSPRLPLAGLDPGLDHGDDLETLLAEPEQWGDQWFEDPGEGCRAYIATALTGLEEDVRDLLRDLCEDVARELADNGIAVHQPILHTDPVDHPHYSPRQIHEIDVAKTMEADLIVAICLGASTGVGKELAYAERYRTPTLVLIPSTSPASRLVLGATTDVEVQTFDNQAGVRAIVADYLRRRGGDLNAHRNVRVGRESRYAADLGRLRAAVRRRGEPFRHPEAASAAMLTPSRIDEMLSSPAHLAGATLDEYDALCEALGLPPDRAAARTRDERRVGPGLRQPTPTRRLGDRELLALESAAEIKRWSGARTVALLRAAEQVLAQEGVRRLRFLSADDWIDFAAGGSSE